MASRSSSTSRDPASWASALRRARQQAGLTQRQLAEHLGLAQETIRATELGRPPRHSTLMACLAALPALRASDLLPGRPAPPVATPAAWRWYRQLFGFSADAVRLERKASGKARLRLQVLGLRTEAASLMQDTAVRLAVMRAACAGPKDLVLSLDAAIPRRKERRYHAADGTHVFRFEGPLSALVLSYEFVGELADPALLEHALDYPARRLELAWRGADDLPEGEVVVASARPEPMPAESADPALARHMHPDAQLRRERRGLVRWTVDHPMPGFAYSLRTSVEPCAAQGLPRGTLAETLRAARMRSGLSIREVATLAGTSHASLSYAESGRDPRTTTLMGYLHALPGLAPQDLLPAVPQDGFLTAEQVWRLMRDLYGYEIAEVTKTVTVAPDGTSTTVIDTAGLRPIRDDLREFKVRAGLHRAIAQASESVLQSVETDLAETKVRLVRRQDGPVVHEFRFPRSLARGAISYRRTYSGAAFPLSRAQSRKARGTEDVVSGVALAVYHPARRIVLQVQMPAGFRPNFVQAHAFPTCVPADAEIPNMSPALHPPPCRIVQENGRTRLALAVEQPAMGIRYAISWGVP